MALVELWRETGERRYLGARPAPDRPARPRLLGVGRFGPGTGRTTGRSARPPPWPVTPCASCTSMRRRRRRGRDRRPALLDAVIRRGPTWSAPGLPDRRARQPAPRRGLRRPVRAAARPRLRRDVRGDRERHARLAPAAGDRRAALRRRDRADRAQRVSRRCRSTARASSTSTRCSGAATGSSDDPPRARARRGTPAHAARRTSCACSLVGAVPGHRRRRRRAAPPAGARDIDAPVAGGAVRLAIETGYPWTGRVVVRVEATPATPWMLSLRIPPGTDRAVLTVDGDGRRTSWASGSSTSAGSGNPATRSSSTSVWPRPSARPTRASMRPAGASPPARPARVRDRDGRPARWPGAGGRRARPGGAPRADGP